MVLFHDSVIPETLGVEINTKRFEPITTLSGQLRTFTYLRTKEDKVWGGLVLVVLSSVTRHKIHS